MADTNDSNSFAERRVGSTPTSGNLRACDQSRLASFLPSARVEHGVDG